MVGKLRFLVCFIALIPLLIGCNNNQVHKIDLENSSIDNFTINDQNFKIIPYYEAYIEYMNNLNNASSDSQLFYEEVLLPMTKELKQGNLENDPHFSLPNNLGTLKDSISGLDVQHDEILSAINTSLEDATQLLKGGDYNIYLLPFYSGYNSQDMQGVAGFAVDSGSIVLQIDPKIFTAESIKYAIAHEYHHAVLMESSEYKSRSFNLLDIVVMEGKADIFTKLVYPEYIVPWIEPIDESESKAVLDYISINKSSYKDEDLHKMEIGSSYEGIPRWSNYKIGFQIMHNYLERNPDVPIQEWSFYNTKEIIENTEYASDLY